MKLGHSLLLQQLLGADEVGYEDCKDFQLVCPACHEAVFKVGDPGNDRQYLSHYASSKSELPDCELRVASTTAAEIDFRNASAHAQHLALFQRVFREAALEELLPEASQRRRASDKIDAMMQRPSYRVLVRVIRDFLDDTDDTDLPVQIDAAYADRSPFWRKRQVSFARGYLRHLRAPNSFKSISFGVAAGFLIFEAAPAIAEETARITNAVSTLSDRDLRSYLIDAERSGCDSQPRPGGLMAAIVAVATLGLTNVLVEFPYINVIRDAQKKRQP